MYRGLASLLRAGFPVREAVGRLGAAGTLPRALGERVEAEVGRGRPLSEGLALFPDAVPKEDVALVEAGEATGNLDRTLDRLADRHEARRAARKRFFTDSAYPLILFHVAALLIPLPSAVAKHGLNAGSAWLGSVLAILLPAYALAGAVIWLHRTARGRAILRRIVEVLPGFGSAARRRRRADFAEVLGAAYEAGVQLDRAVSLAAGAAGEPRAAAAAAVVARGSTLCDALSSAAFLPEPLLGRIAVGEQSGDLSKVLGHLAREEAEASEHTLRRTTVILAKVIYLAVAAWIVFHVVSTYLGLYGPLLR